VSRDCLWEESGNDIYRKDGNIGIGTTQPNKKLHIHASSNLGPQSSEGKVQIESPSWWNGQLQIKNNDLDDPNGYDETSIGFISERNNRFWVIGPGAGTGMISDKFGIAYGEGNPDTTGAYPAYVTVTNNGNVGIGTAEPHVQLHVHSSTSQGAMNISGISDNGRTYSALYLNDETLDHHNNSWVIAHKKEAGTPYEDALWFARWKNNIHSVPMVIQSTGNVGIGTMEPNGRFNVAGDIRVGLLTDEDDAMGAHYGDFLRFSGGDDWASWNSDNSDLMFIARYNVANDVSELRINIGDNPGQGADKLNIGNSFASDPDNFASVMVVQMDGNVGIGTTEPQHKLDVEGYVQAHGYYTGDIVFQKDGNKLWRMFEDEEGLYLESLKTGKVYRFVLEEIMNK
jgi:hypothetical protein